MKASSKTGSPFFINIKKKHIKIIIMKIFETFKEKYNDKIIKENNSLIERERELAYNILFSDKKVKEEFKNEYIKAIKNLLNKHSKDDKYLYKSIDHIKDMFSHQRDTVIDYYSKGDVIAKIFAFNEVKSRKGFKWFSKAINKEINIINLEVDVLGEFIGNAVEWIPNEIWIDILEIDDIEFSEEANKHNISNPMAFMYALEEMLLEIEEEEQNFNSSKRKGKVTNILVSELKHIVKNTLDETRYEDIEDVAGDWSYYFGKYYK